MCLINCIILVLSSFMIDPSLLASVSVLLKVSLVCFTLTEYGYIACIRK